MNSIRNAAMLQLPQLSTLLIRKGACMAISRWCLQLDD